MASTRVAGRFLLGIASSRRLLLGRSWPSPRLANGTAHYDVLVWRAAYSALLVRRRYRLVLGTHTLDNRLP